MSWPSVFFVLTLHQIRITVKRLFFVIFLLLTSTLLAPLSAKDYTIVIDPGHGGHDPGAIGFVSREKNITLKVALELGRLVKQNMPNTKVIYTRSTDKFVALAERANIANRNKADLFISIHTNSTASGRKGTQARGTETFTLGMHATAENLEVAKRENSVITMESDYEEKYEGFDPSQSESYIIFELMQDEYMKQSVHLADLIQSQFVRHAGRANRGVRQGGLLVLKNSSMPSVLVELGFINNRSEERYLNTNNGVAAMARSIYNAIKSYRQQNEVK